MGTDAHPHIEVKGKNGRWKLLDEKYHYFDEAEKAGKHYSDLDRVRPSYINVLGNRDYLMFAILADVRNGGWGDRARYVEPLFASRGVPSNVAKATKNEIPLDSDYHSHTHFTVKELMDTNWDAVAGNKFEVCLFAADYMNWKETGKVPQDAEEYPQTFDDATREVSHEEMVMLLLGTPPNELTKMVNSRFDERSGRRVRKVRSGPYVKVSTEKTYRQCVPQLIECIPDLQKLGDPDKVRIVIAFDN